MASIAVRTVRRGRIKIGGVVFAPDTRFQRYQGELDGQRIAFARYRDYETGGWKPLLELWGSEHAYRHCIDGPQDDCPECWPPPGTQPDGVMPWSWWHSVESANPDAEPLGDRLGIVEDGNAFINRLTNA